MLIKQRCLIVIIGMLVNFLGQSQSLDLGVGIGGVLYNGDLNTAQFGKNLSNANVAIQVNASYTLTDYVSLRGGVLYGTLSGTDSKATREWQRERNLNFTSSLLETSFIGEVHILKNNNLKKSIFSPFIALGISGFYFNPQTILDGQTYDLQPLGTEGQGLPGYNDKYKRISGSILFGGGVKLRLTNSVTIVGDLLFRRTLTDYIDDVSGTYVSYPELAAGNGEIAARLGNRQGEYLGLSEPVILPTGSPRGGGSVNDYYITTMVTFYIKLFDGVNGFGGFNKNSVKCPKF